MSDRTPKTLASGSDRPSKTARTSPSSSSWGEKVLNGIETVGNKLPEPFTLFLGLFLITGVASTVMALQGISVSVPGSDKQVAIKGLFTGEGMTWLTVNLGKNYVGFPPLVTVLPILLAVGVAERSGMLSALIRRGFSSAKKWTLPYAVGIVGVGASVMADSAWVVVPPLAALVFKSAGRHPVAGLLGGFASVGAGYSTAFVPTSLDALFAGITNAVMETLPHSGATEVNPLSNFYFNFVSAVILGLVAGFITDRILEPRMWKQDVPVDETIDPEDAKTRGDRDENGEELSPNLSREESRGLWASLFACLVLTVIILASTLYPGSPWRNPEGGFLPKSPLLDSIVFIVFAYFMVMGIVYGAFVGTVKNMEDAVEMMGHALKDMLSFLILAFILGQFVALFSWTGIGTYTAVKGAALLESMHLTGFPAILAFIILASCLNLLLISGSAMWTLMASVFVPMFALLGYEPSFVQAAFRVGDSATQVMTPLNPYMIVVLGLLRRYEPEAGLGTLMSRLVPFVVPFWLSWVLILFAWYIADLPLGPGSGIFIP
ncbi:AbgT family transporter [Corynebacterium epidermidicanis]|uniref:Putative p-aminobenzoyl-glutamate transporter n=1 Tax=Corynebacterium epidermidicanis TaxID=1050174 RepID=A0A0G3GVY6_9CORY|nr:AbgT family transporter [Corynebacterium epidermidicanis]AKK03668.1 putative p-aminobenzoyl-glutamate transporter [Corynebacterium epidermidicanis]